VEAACATVTVAGYARTPFGRFGGRLRDVSLPALGAAAIRAALGSAAMSSADVDLVVLGVNFPGSDRSVARQAALTAGIGEDRTSLTVDRACCSSLTATSVAAASLLLGTATTAVAGGVENLSLVPYFLHGARWGRRLGDIVLADQLIISCPYTHEPRAMQASREAMEWGIDRAAQDEWAVRSQRAYADALVAGHFASEISATVFAADGEPDVTLDTDEVPRPDTTLAKLAALPTVNGSDTVTAGNAPDLSTGATALVLRATESEAATPGVARLTGFTSTSGPPRNIASIPAKAIQLALARTGWGLDDMDLFEINEAFAAVPLVSIAVLADGNERLAKSIAERTNVNGGAIAVGHPTGATAARLIMTLIAELHRRRGGRGVVGICGGIGEAEAVVVEVGPEHVQIGPEHVQVTSPRPTIAS
jgi:acetyl-CoA C-acetyltransferase